MAILYNIYQTSFRIEFEKCIKSIHKLSHEDWTLIQSLALFQEWQTHIYKPNPAGRHQSKAVLFLTEYLERFGEINQKDATLLMKRFIDKLMQKELAIQLGTTQRAIKHNQNDAFDSFFAFF